MAPLPYEGSRELRWLEVGSCLVVFMEAEVEFTDRHWDVWMEAIGRPGVTGLVIASWGATQPSHQQWRRATRLMRDRKLPVAVVSQARHNFALAKAASWLGTNVEAFRWRDLGDALGFVGFADGGKVVAKAQVVALRDRFGAMTAHAELEGHLSRERADAAEPGFEASSAIVFENNEEIQTKLAEIQARLAARKLS